MKGETVRGTWASRGWGPDWLSQWEEKGIERNQRKLTVGFIHGKDSECERNREEWELGLKRVTRGDGSFTCSADL